MSFDKEKYEHVTLDIEDSGYDIYIPTSSTAYRYGPSIIKNEDGSYLYLILPVIFNVVN